MPQLRCGEIGRLVGFLDVKVLVVGCRVTLIVPHAKICCGLRGKGILSFFFNCPIFPKSFFWAEGQYSIFPIGMVQIPLSSWSFFRVVLFTCI